MAHENMHGWEFQFASEPAGIGFYMAFARFANIVYQLEKNNPSKWTGTVNGNTWTLNYLTYGLQNEALVCNQ